MSAFFPKPEFLVLAGTVGLCFVAFIFNAKAAAAFGQKKVPDPLQNRKQSEPKSNRRFFRQVISLTFKEIICHFLIF